LRFFATLMVAPLVCRLSISIGAERAVDETHEADDTARVTEQIKAVSPGGVLDLPAGTFNIRKLAIKRDAVTLRGPAIFRCIETNSYFIEITGSDIRLEGIQIDGAGKAAAGLVAGPNSHDWTLQNVSIVNCYLDDVLAPKGGGVADGILVKYGCERFKLYSCNFSNINHTPSTGRVSRGFRATSYGAPAGSPKQLHDLLLEKCTFEAIAPELEGDCILIESGADAQASVGVIVTNCVFRNFGRRAGKFLSRGGSVEGNSVARKEFGAWVYAGFSFYGSDWECRNNDLRGELPIAIEVGSGLLPASSCTISGNVFVCGPKLANQAVGIDLTECERVTVVSNVVENCKFHTRLYGRVREAVIAGARGKDIHTTGIEVVSDGKNAPSNCTIKDTEIDAPAKYGVRVDAGTNIDESGTRGRPAFQKVYFGPAVSRIKPKASDSGNK
jgi:hypothetical protein